MSRPLILTAVVLTLLAAMACSSEDSVEVISREQFVEAYVELRSISQRSLDEAIPLAERDRVLQELGLTPEDLEEFVELHGTDPTFMYEVWEEVDTRFREMRSTPPPPPRSDSSLPPGADPSRPPGGTSALPPGAQPSRPPGDAIRPVHIGEGSSGFSAPERSVTPAQEAPMTFQRTFSGAPWEEEVAYCRALRSGNVIYVTGTAPVDPDGNVHAPGDGLAQARRCLEIIKEALADLGVGMDRVVRTRIFVTDIDRWQEYAEAHREAFREHPPPPWWRSRA
jgi:enamine deaminase RidA (YjgF/YER057c/UK114 family)